MSYSWISVRAFYYYLARQVEQRRLKWNDIPAIRETAAVSFKHSDILTVPRPLNGRTHDQMQAKSNQKDARMGTTAVLALARPALSHMPPFMSVGFANRLPIICCIV